jgi:hypothetical protein
LLAPEKFSLGALLVMSITSNFNGRGVKTLMNLKEGLHNVALGLLTSFMSYTISNHLMLGAEGYTAYSVDGVDAVSEGGKALWFMLILVEYTAIMFASTFALFYLDETRKRVSTMAIRILEIQFIFILPCNYNVSVQILTF